MSRDRPTGQNGTGKVPEDEKQSFSDIWNYEQRKPKSEKAEGDTFEKYWNYTHLKGDRNI